MAAALRLHENNTLPSSSPAFGTPVHPINPRDKRIPPPAFRPSIPTILPILLPPASLRSVAFRVFTKKHNLTLSSPALQSLATFVGKHCGSAWRERGTAEGVLEEVAKAWKSSSGPLIVNDGSLLKNILKTLESIMAGGKIAQSKSNLSRQSSFAFAEPDSQDSSRRPSLAAEASFISQDNDQDETSDILDPRAWIKVISAFDQPRLSYNVHKKHFEKMMTKSTLLPSPAHRTQLFRDRYNLIHHRLMRNEAFQAPSVANMRSLKRQDSTSVQQFYKITPIANLLGRNGSSHVLLGMLVITPTGTLALNDLTGSITLDLQHAKPLQGVDSSYFCPGMIVLVEGVYEEAYAGAGAGGLGAATGVGGTIGGKFIGFSIGGPPSEKRTATLGISDPSKQQDIGVGGGFGWTDFLGLGSEKVMGVKMRKLERRLLAPQPTQDAPSQQQQRRKMVILGEVNLDDPSSLEALRAVLRSYAENDNNEQPTPLSFMLIGNFVSHPVMAGGGSGGSIEYKEYFNDLATILSDFPVLLRTATWIFVPGDNDPWASAFSAGASNPVPRSAIPSLFISRVKRAFAAAHAETPSLPKTAEHKDIPLEPIWTSNPARISIFGPAHEIAVFRDDISSRLRRNAITFGKAATSPDDDEEMQDDGDMPPDIPTPTQIARKLVLSLLPQSHLSPFPLSTRPVLWDQGSAMSLYPLPHTLVLADAEAPAFCVTFEGCHVINPGRLCRDEGGAARRGRRVQWVEYDCWDKRGEVREIWSSSS
jgi:DNA polymerase epsilon subunit 2